LRFDFWNLEFDFPQQNPTKLDFFRHVINLRPQPQRVLMFSEIREGEDAPNGMLLFFPLPLLSHA
jgi:hypothetical protein